MLSHQNMTSGLQPLLRRTAFLLACDLLSDRGYILIQAAIVLLEICCDPILSEQHFALGCIPWVMTINDQLLYGFVTTLCTCMSLYVRIRETIFFTS